MRYGIYGGHFIGTPPDPLPRGEYTGFEMSFTLDGGKTWCRAWYVSNQELHASSTTHGPMYRGITRVWRVACDGQGHFRRIPARRGEGKEK